MPPEEKTMAKTTALQDRLNKIADEKLEKDISEVQKAITAHFYSGWGNIEVSLKVGNEEVTARLSDVVKGISDTLRDTMRTRRRDEETAAFMDKVDHLGNEIDSLRDEVGLG